jgi:hypothetical protein
MTVLTPAQLRDFIPACRPSQVFAAFLVVVAVCVVLLGSGVPGAVLPATLLAITVLVMILAGPERDRGAVHPPRW